VYYLYISDEVEIKELFYPCEYGRDICLHIYSGLHQVEHRCGLQFQMPNSLVFFCNRVFSCWISKLNKWCVSSCSLVRNSEVLFGPFSAADGTCEWKMSYLSHGSTWTASILSLPEAEYFILQGGVWTSWGPCTFSLLSIG
jgi:hypothetical protein